MDKRVEAGARALARLRCERNARLDHTPRDEAFLAGAVEHAWPYWVEESTAVLAAADAVSAAAVSEKDAVLLGTIETAIGLSEAMVSVTKDDLARLLALARRGATAPVVPAIRPLNWSCPEQPDAECSYDHVIADGLFTYRIEWKGWKEFDSFTVYRDKEFIGNGLTLDDAKSMAARDLASKVIGAISAPLRTEEEIRKDERRKLAEAMDVKAAECFTAASDAYDRPGMEGASDGTFHAMAARNYQFAAAAIRHPPGGQGMKLTEHEIETLEMLDGRKPFVWGSYVSACLEALSEIGLVTRSLPYAITDAGRAALEKAD